MTPIEYPAHGGTYNRNEDGSLELIEEPTKDHPEGNRARDKDGNPIVLPVPASKGGDQ